MGSLMAQAPGKPLTTKRNYCCYGCIRGRAGGLAKLKSSVRLSSIPGAPEQGLARDSARPGGHPHAACVCFLILRTLEHPQKWYNGQLSLCPNSYKTCPHSWEVPLLTNPWLGRAVPVLHRVLAKATPMGSLGSSLPSVRSQEHRCGQEYSQLAASDTHTEPALQETLVNRAVNACGSWRLRQVWEEGCRRRVPENH